MAYIKKVFSLIFRLKKILFVIKRYSKEIYNNLEFLFHILFIEYKIKFYKVDKIDKNSLVLIIEL